MVYDIFYVSKNVIDEHEWKQFRQRFPSAQKIDNVNSFSDIKKKAFTKLFWVVWDDIEIAQDFTFDYQVPEWDQDYIHVWLNDLTYDGVVLFSKNSEPTKKEFDHRFYLNKKEIDVVASIPKKFKICNINSYDEYLNAAKTSNTELFWIVFDDLVIEDSFKFDIYISHHDFYNRNENHVFLNNTTYDGLILASRNKIISKKEFDHRFLVDKKEWDIVATSPKPFEVYYLDSYEEFLSVKESTTSKMFWVVWNDINISEDFDFDYYVPVYDTFHRNITHIFKNKDFYDGICLFSKHKDITKKEFDHRFFVDKVEVDILASIPKLYDIFYIDTYADYVAALENSTTDLFWIIPNDVDVVEEFKFDLYFSHHDAYERQENHMFLNGNTYDGVILASKFKLISEKEFKYRFLVDRKEWEMIASRPKEFEKFNIKSYTDYLTACEQSKTDMFWAIWDDIELSEDFTFDYYVPVYDTFHRNITHIFKNRDFYDGICLFSKYKNVSKKEFDHRFFVDKVEVDLIASRPKQYDQFIITDYNDYLKAVDNSHTEMFWGVWSNVKVINQKIFDTYFNHHDRQSRNENHVFKNICNTRESFVNGIVLFSKNLVVSKKEIDHKFLINKKEYNILASRNQYAVHVISSYDQYLDICQNEKQPLFWCVWPDIDIIDNTIFNLYFDPTDGRYDYDRSVNHIFKNQVGTEESFISGIALCTTTSAVSKKEIEHRFFIDKKEHDQLASKSRLYEQFVIETFKDYENARDTATTDMFWMIPAEVEPAQDFKFDLQFAYQNNYERSMNHVFKNKDVEEVKYNGIMLLSKQASVSAREIEYRYLIEKKEHDVVASKLKLYDIIFISYNEPNADENFSKLVSKFPRAKRVHGVKGIHQAHIAAANLATTPMFWVVDGDALVEDSFKFDLLLPKHDTDIVHVWLSRNPVNDLTYGYGGVKLLPKTLTKNMNVDQLDMTMSISKKFKVIQEVSNITAFNTDPFNTWKSAFRECVKLASRPITASYQEDTEDRLDTWCTVGSDRVYGDYSLAGARAGKQYGLENISNPEKLAKINDFEWLQDYFKTHCPLLETL